MSQSFCYASDNVRPPCFGDALGERHEISEPFSPSLYRNHALRMGYVSSWSDLERPDVTGHLINSGVVFGHSLTSSSS